MIIPQTNVTRIIYHPNPVQSAHFDFSNKAKKSLLCKQKSLLCKHQSQSNKCIANNYIRKKSIKVFSQELKIFKTFLDQKRVLSFLKRLNSDILQTLYNIIQTSNVIVKAYDFGGEIILTVQTNMSHVSKVSLLRVRQVERGKNE